MVTKFAKILLITLLPTTSFADFFSFDKSPDELLSESISSGNLAQVYKATSQCAAFLALVHKKDADNLSEEELATFFKQAVELVGTSSYLAERMHIKWGLVPNSRNINNLIMNEMLEHSRVMTIEMDAQYDVHGEYFSDTFKDYNEQCLTFDEKVIEAINSEKLRT